MTNIFTYSIYLLPLLEINAHFSVIQKGQLRKWDGSQFCFYFEAIQAVVDQILGKLMYNSNILILFFFFTFHNFF